MGKTENLTKEKNKFAIKNFIKSKYIEFPSSIFQRFQSKLNQSIIIWYIGYLTMITHKAGKTSLHRLSFISISLNRVTNIG